MSNKPTDAEDEMVKRGLIGCNIPLDGPLYDKMTIDPLWLLEYLHRNAKDLKSIEINFKDYTVYLIHHDKAREIFELK